MCKAIMDLMADSKDEGRAEGRAEDILDFLGEYGTVDEELSKKIKAQSDPEILRRWVKIAARCGSTAAFEAAMEADLKSAAAGN